MRIFHCHRPLPGRPIFLIAITFRLQDIDRIGHRMDADRKVRNEGNVRRRCRSGFTLIELMIVVAVVAILAAIAYPSYLAQVRKGHRAAAQSYLMDLAQREQQYMLDARSYTGNPADLGYRATPGEVSPWYNVTIAPGATPPTFLITATATGQQALDAAVLSVDNLGTKLPPDKW